MINSSKKYLTMQMFTYTYSRKHTNFVKNYSKIHENLLYLYSSEIYKIHTNHQEKLNIIQIKCIYFGANDIKYIRKT